MFSCMVDHQKKKKKEKRKKISLELSIFPVLVFVACSYYVKLLSFT